MLGYPYGQVIPHSEMLWIIGRIPASVSIPITAEIEAGYRAPVAEVLEMV
jgi:2-methylisocitrate lyase-like PEP mutase family enzyme